MDGVFRLEDLLWGFEPEGTWQGSGGALQPEVASAAAEVESLRLHQKNPVANATGFFNDIRLRRVILLRSDIRLTPSDITLRAV